MKHFTKSKKQLFEEFETVSTGLTNEEVEKRRKKYGENKFIEKEKDGLIKIFFNQFKDSLVIILLVAAIISFFSGNKESSFVIVLVLILNSILGAYQTIKAQKSLDSLKKMSSPKCKVIRDHEQLEVDSSELVPGDIVVIEAGDIVPADGRIIENFSLLVNENSLTGESNSIEKTDEVLHYEDLALGDQVNMVFSGSLVNYGRAKILITETGMSTQLGKIATLLDQTEENITPLQKSLDIFGKRLTLGIVVLCVFIFGIYVYHGNTILDSLLLAVALAVAAIPESLNPIITIVLSLGMTKMVKKNAIVKKLLAVETLGTTTVICSDKTGTLTQNEMTVKKVFVNNLVYDVEGTGYEPVGDVLLDGVKVNAKEIEDFISISKISTLVNDAKLIKDGNMYKIVGDPTEGALLTLSEKVDISKDDLSNKHKRIAEIPFDSTRKMMTTFNENIFSSNVISATKGAPDIVIDNCKYILINGKEEEFTSELKDKVLLQNSQFAKQALRVLAFAYRKFDSLPGDRTSENIEKDMIFVGLMGMIDPARPEAKEAIKECRNAGIIPIMITGDYLETAVAIAKDLGILDEHSKAIMGRELNKMTEEEICEVVKTTRVFARVSPENKVQIVSALKKNGHIVAMTGDGVNDAPAIKRADIGVSMGITGTDVAKNTSDVILTDDNFTTIVHAIEEGRNIYNNIKKTIIFLLSCNLGEIICIFLSTLLNWDLPLVATQLLWVNLVTDTLPALALGIDPGDKDVMKRSPRNPKESFFSEGAGMRAVIGGTLIGFLTLAAFYIGINETGMIGNLGQLETMAKAGNEAAKHALTQGRTMAFVVLTVSQLFYSLTMRNSQKTIFEIGIFKNKYLIYSIIIGIALQIGLTSFAPIAQVFKVTKISFENWDIVLLFALIPFAVNEVIKLISRKKSK